MVSSQVRDISRTLLKCSLFQKALLYLHQLHMPFVTAIEMSQPFSHAISHHFRLTSIVFEYMPYDTHCWQACLPDQGPC